MSATKKALQQPEESAQAPGATKKEAATTADSANTTTNKRKRDVADHEEAAGDAGASNKRASTPKNTVNQSIADLANSAFMTGQQNSTVDEDGQSASANQLDFESLAQQHNSEQTAQPNGDPNPTDATSTAAAALAGIYPTMTVPQPTDLSFASAASGDGDRSNLDPSFGMGENDQANQSFDIDSMGANGQSATGGSLGQKPAVGSEEWHRVRRDNHKEVERRRRETINEGINELAKIVPGCEKNKGSILQRAVAFITQLKENEAQNIEKWTLEKLLTEQAIAELSGSVDKLKNECERAWREAETWKKTCQGAGLTAKQGSDEPAAANSTEGAAASNGEA